VIASKLFYGAIPFRDIDRRYEDISKSHAEGAVWNTSGFPVTHRRDGAEILAEMVAEMAPRFLILCFALVLG